MDGQELVTADGSVLWGAVEGEGSGPPIGLCHGGPGLWDYFDSFASALGDCFTVYRWDQRGCGRSQPSHGYKLDVAVNDVQDIKVAFGVGPPWVVLGHSWGAYLALLTALQYPESTKALIYISGTGLPSWWSRRGSRAYKAERFRRMSVDSQRRLDELTRIDRTWDQEVEFRRLSWITDFADRRRPPEALETMATTPLSINWSVHRQLSRATLYSDVELLDACSRSEMPSLFIHGSEDPRPQEGARLLCEQVPAGRFVVIDGAGHLPWVERPKETTEVIQSFLDDVYA